MSWFQATLVSDASMHICMVQTNRETLHTSNHSGSEINLLSINWYNFSGYNTIWSLLQCCILQWLVICIFHLSLLLSLIKNIKYPTSKLAVLTFYLGQSYRQRLINLRMIRYHLIHKQFKRRRLFFSVLVSAVHKMLFYWSFKIPLNN